MNLKEIKEEIDLIRYARDYHGLACNSKGKAKCPFHPPDNHPSFTISFDEGIWKWYDPHDETGGTIVDFECKFAKLTEKQAIKRLLERFGNKKLPTAKKSVPANYKIPIKKIIPYIYKDLDGNEVLKKEKKIHADGSKTYAWCHKKDGQWNFTIGDFELIPYRLDQFKDHDKIILCEGEKDADTINSLGLGEFATTAPAGASSWPSSITKYFAGKEIVFLYDVGVEEEVKDHASELKRTYPDMKVFIASVPLEEKNADITDCLEQLDDKKQKQITLADILSKSKEFTKKDIVPLSNLLIPISSKLSEIPSEPIEWLWDNKLPLGKLCMLVGDPGVGKSFFTIYMASRITTGQPWPDIGAPITKGSVIYLTAEDDMSDTVRPRADAMGADVEKIYTFSEVKARKDDKPEFFNLEHNMPSLSYLIKEIGDVRLVVIDDVNSYIGKIDISNIAVVRSVLMPTILMARELQVSMLLVSHLNKDKAQKALFRTIGSIGFIAAARAVWAVSRDPEDISFKRRFLTSIKNNLSINPKNLAFNFVGSSMQDSKIEFEPHPVDITSEEALAPGEEQELGALANAEEWVTQLFQNENDILVEEILLEAKESGIAEKTLRRAKKKLGLKSLKQGMAKDRQWIWRK